MAFHPLEILSGILEAIVVCGYTMVAYSQPVQSKCSQEQATIEE